MSFNDVAKFLTIWSDFLVDATGIIPMKIIEKKKLEELLATNWSKFINYKTIEDIIADLLPLYAQNWSTIQATSNLQLKKINLTKFEITENNLIAFWANFEFPFKNKFAVGTAEFQCPLSQEGYVVSNIVGNIYVS